METERGLWPLRIPTGCLVAPPQRALGPLCDLGCARPSLGVPGRGLDSAYQRLVTQGPLSRPGLRHRVGLRPGRPGAPQSRKPCTEKPRHPWAVESESRVVDGRPEWAQPGASAGLQRGPGPPCLRSLQTLPAPAPQRTPVQAGRRGAPCREGSGPLCMQPSSRALPLVPGRPPALGLRWQGAWPPRPRASCGALCSPWPPPAPQLWGSQASPEPGGEQGREPAEGLGPHQRSDEVPLREASGD